MPRAQAAGESDCSRAPLTSDGLAAAARMSCTSTRAMVSASYTHDGEASAVVDVTEKPASKRRKQGEQRVDQVSFDTNASRSLIAAPQPFA